MSHEPAIGHWFLSMKLATPEHAFVTDSDSVQSLAAPVWNDTFPGRSPACSRMSSSPPLGQITPSVWPCGHHAGHTPQPSGTCV